MFLSHYIDNMASSSSNTRDCEKMANAADQMIQLYKDMNKKYEDKLVEYDNSIQRITNEQRNPIMEKLANLQRDLANVEQANNWQERNRTRVDCGIQHGLTDDKCRDHFGTRMAVAIDSSDCRMDKPPFGWHYKWARCRVVDIETQSRLKAEIENTKKELDSVNQRIIVLQNEKESYRINNKPTTDFNFQCCSNTVNARDADLSNVMLQCSQEIRKNIAQTTTVPVITTAAPTPSLASVDNVPGYDKIPITDYPGNDLGDNASVPFCIKSCNDNPSCIGFVTSKNQNKCWWKSKFDNVTTNADITGYKKQIISSDIPGYDKISSNSYPGNDLGDSASLSVCIKACNDNPSCAGFDTSLNQDHCWWKNKLENPNSDANRTSYKKKIISDAIITTAASISTTTAAITNKPTSTPTPKPEKDTSTTNQILDFLYEYRYYIGGGISIIIILIIAIIIIRKLTR
jgi:hypothetical protein